VAPYFRTYRSYFLNRATRELIKACKASAFATAKTEPFIVELPIESLPPWLRLEEIEAAINESALETLARLARRPVTPGEMLARKNVPPELRSQAARSMLAMRGGRATAAKMRAVGFPNLVNAREALRLRVAERRAKAAVSLRGANAATVLANDERKV
jgi:hypothetical protein